MSIKIVLTHEASVATTTRLLYKTIKEKYKGKVAYQPDTPYVLGSLVRAKTTVQEEVDGVPHKLETDELTIFGMVLSELHPYFEGHLNPTDLVSWSLPYEVSQAFCMSSLVDMVVGLIIDGDYASKELTLDVSSFNVPKEVQELLIKCLTPHGEVIKLHYPSGEIKTSPYAFGFHRDYPGKNLYDYDRINLILNDPLRSDFQLSSIAPTLTGRGVNGNPRAVSGGNGGKDSTLCGIVMEHMGYAVTIVDVPKEQSDTRKISMFRDVIDISESFSYDLESKEGEEIHEALTTDKDREPRGDNYYYMAQYKSPAQMYSGWIYELLKNGANHYAVNFYGGHFAHDSAEEGQTDLIVDEGHLATSIGRYIFPSIGPALGLSEAGIMYLLIKHNPDYRSWYSFRYSCWTYESIIAKGENIPHTVKACEYCAKCNRYKLIIQAMKWCGDSEVEGYARQIESEFLTKEIYIPSPVDFGATALDYTYSALVEIVEAGSSGHEHKATRLWRERYISHHDTSISTTKGQLHYEWAIQDALHDLGSTSTTIPRPELIELKLPTYELLEAQMGAVLTDNYVNSYMAVKNFMDALKEESPKVYAIVAYRVLSNVVYFNVWGNTSQHLSRLANNVSVELLCPLHLFTDIEAGEGVVKTNPIHKVVEGLVKDLPLSSLALQEINEVWGKNFILPAPDASVKEKAFYAVFANSNQDADDKDGLVRYWSSLDLGSDENLYGDL